ncbi:copper chaperone PCu(A)C [Leucobacter weissii]|uniref:Copper chaperone PCu(A)C n=1 Tax=Leucobacter weissii TaxID=1983706 RepID=A0A939MM59_9MICO|nr:copper chaperone PCu(A)C [Leucobacter weissii]MBO1900996.1 copper chaperone PCu(A)C [Leucobacter weissii]
MIISAHSRPNTRRRTLALASAAVLALSAPLLLSACSSPAAAPSGGAANESPASPAPASDHPLGIEGAWVKATSADLEPGTGMSGAFGTLVNTGSEDVEITGASSTAAGTVELHEVVDGTMREIDGGFVVPAGGTLELAPGGLHIMLMEIAEPILTGDTVRIDLQLADGSTVGFEALVKDTAGANEEYEGSEEDHGSHEHADGEDHDHEDGHADH